jgi:hypothetical protein
VLLPVGEVPVVAELEFEKEWPVAVAADQEEALSYLRDY